MGHRALVAYRKPNGEYLTRYSHWGAHDLELQHKITEETPLGGENDLEPGFINAFSAAVNETAEELADDGESAEVGGRLMGPQDQHNVAETVDDGLDLPAVFDSLDDAWYEALYLVDAQADPWTVRGYHVLSDMTGDALLYAPSWVGDQPTSLSFDRGWFRGRKDTLQESVDRGDKDETAANDVLVRGFLNHVADSLDKTVHPLSPALDEGHWHDHTEAFLRFGGKTRVLGDMWPTKVLDHRPFEVPDGFPDVKTASGDRVSPV